MTTVSPVVSYLVTGTWYLFPIIPNHNKIYPSFDVTKKPNPKSTIATAMEELS